MSQTGAQVVSAIGDVATAVDKSNNGNLGVKGWILTNIVQMTAATIVAGAMMYTGYMVIDEWRSQSADNREQGREDRAMFRTAIKDIQTDQNTRADKMESAMNRQVEKMGVMIDRSIRALDDSQVQTKEAVKELKEAVRVVSKLNGPKPNP